MDESTDWRFDALCTQVGPDPWHLQQGESAMPAKRICMACPVRRQCLEFALTHDEHGIWGGTTERERRAISHDRLTRAS
jgi:WhiB family transcriptional regulator, redox-sensing transcriptional regulator